MKFRATLVTNSKVTTIQNVEIDFTAESEEKAEEFIEEWSRGHLSHMYLDEIWEV